MLNVDKGVEHVDNRWKKMEKPFVQQIQDARFNPMSLLNSIRHVKSASRYQSTELTRLAFLRPYLADAMFSNARSASLLRDTRPASLCQNARLTKSASLKYHQTNATINNARSASLISRGTRPASQSQNARAASVLQNVYSAFLNLASLKLARLTFAIRRLGSEGS